MPGSAKKGIEKPRCGPSELASILKGDYAELFGQFVAFLKHRDAAADLAASNAHSSSVAPTGLWLTIKKDLQRLQKPSLRCSTPIGHQSQVLVGYQGFILPALLHGLVKRGPRMGKIRWGSCDVRASSAAPPLGVQGGGGGLSYVPFFFSMGKSRAVPVSGALSLVADVDYDF